MLYELYCTTFDVGNETYLIMHTFFHLKYSQLEHRRRNQCLFY